ncbi:hypothetical protein VNO78_07226 [Psophocarpus tetragonolobus]|uniref:Uncharacterized protein n=1 Tax=Psophocarpus tetragonolobus TaxID=3891 RepID=A0AAN9XRS0_PSOTE
MWCRYLSARVLVVVVLMCLMMNELSLAYPFSESSLNASDANINVLFLSFFNGMSPNNKNVNLFYNNQKDGVYLLPGKGFTKLDNLNGRKSAEMWWNGYCCSIYAYDPSTEGGHQKVYWLIKEDGAYHSWDNASWQKRKGWTFNKC